MIAATAVTLYVIVAPLAASRYVPMTDLPFHVAQGAAIRHYWDPSYHFHEQFVLRPIAIPYMAINALVAAAMLVFPVLIAAKVALAILLMMVPGGLAVLFHGAKKSPLLGLLGLGICWGHLTHWGFVNYVAALGLFSMVIGLTLLVLDDPRPGRRVGLAVALVALFFTHIFRFPFALAGVVGTAVVMYPATRRFRAVLLPMLPSLVFFALWLKFRPDTLNGKLDLGFHTERLAKEFSAAMTDGFVDDGVRSRLLAYFDVACAVVAACAAHALWQWRRGLRRFTAWDVGVTLVPLCCAAVFLLALPDACRCGWAAGGTSTRARRPRRPSSLLGACPDLPRAAVAPRPAGGGAERSRPRRRPRGERPLRGLRPPTEDFYTHHRASSPGRPSSSTWSRPLGHDGAPRRHALHPPARLRAGREGRLALVALRHLEQSAGVLPQRARSGRVVVPRTPPSLGVDPGAAVQPVDDALLRLVPRPPEQTRRTRCSPATRPSARGSRGHVVAVQAGSERAALRVPLRRVAHCVVRV